MPGIEHHTVSLTKQRYVALIDLIRNYPTDELLNHLDEVSADRAQAVKMLAGDADTEVLPSAWDDIKAYPLQSQWSLFFVSIVFSHRDLIEAFRNSTNAEMRGVIKRSELGDKPYTNLAYALNEAGMIPDYATGRSESRYNLTPVFRDMSIGPLAKQIFMGQLRRMGWAPPTTAELWKRTFYEQCFHYGFHEALGLSTEQFEDWLEGHTVQITQLPEVTPPVATVVASGRLVAALATKNFVILAGGTGTGKTQTILRLVQSLNPEGSTDPEFNSAFIPVGAGWTDGRHLVGFRNPFGEGGAAYAITPAIKLLLRANFHAYSEIPFFLTLDEMNLSYVELYFSTFLSLMESSVDGETQPILDVNDLELIARTSGLSTAELVLVDAAIASGGLFLSSNVFIVGTVNVDETTHNFSPKVLDRAFVLEYSPQLPSSVGTDFSIPVDDALTAEASAILRILNRHEFSEQERDQIDKFLDGLFSDLGRFKFGPRVTNEARRYWNICHSVITKNVDPVPESLSSAEAIFDNIVFQKILPKLHGNKSQLAIVLKTLSEHAEEHKLTQSLEKLNAMKADASLLGFANFFSMQ